jgi:hypothetical protein
VDGAVVAIVCLRLKIQNTMDIVIFGRVEKVGFIMVLNMLDNANKINNWQTFKCQMKFFQRALSRSIFL